MLKLEVQRVPFYTRFSLSFYASATYSCTPSVYLPAHPHMSTETITQGHSLLLW